MEFWVLWFIGIVIVIGTRIAINKFFRNADKNNNNKIMQIVINLLVFICIVLVGGIVVAKWIGNFANPDISFWVSGGKVDTILFISLTTILGAALTYLVGFCVLGLYYFDKRWLHVCFVVVFIFSIVGWSIPICNYNRNIEKTTETIVEQKQENQLVYFCNIPVQQISGAISGSFILGSGNVSGEINTTEKLPYWYLNQNGEAVYNSVSTTSSKLRTIEDNETPYVEVISYATQTTTINNNNGIEKITTDNTWTEYIFYLPEEIMQYKLN